MFSMLQEAVERVNAELFESTVVGQMEALLDIEHTEVVDANTFLAFLEDPIYEGEYQDWRKFQKGYQPEVEQNAPKVKVAFCDLFWKQLGTLYRDGGTRNIVRKQLPAFIRLKTEDPTRQFGGTDYPITGASPMSGIGHAALANDLRVLYTIKGGVLNLYGVFRHDDLGMGSIQQVRKRDTMGRKVISQTMDEPITPDEAVKAIE